MYYLIFDGQVASPAMETAPEILPEGFSVATGEYLEPSAAYFDGSQVYAKPPQPSLAHVWDSQTNAWQASIVPLAPPVQDWDGLVSALRGSQIWAIAYGVSELTLKGNAAFTLLYGSLTQTRHLADLIFAFERLRAALQESVLGDYKPEDLDWIRDRLVDHGFDPSLFPLNHE